AVLAKELVNEPADCSQEEPRQDHPEDDQTHGSFLLCNGSPTVRKSTVSRSLKWGRSDSLVDLPLPPNANCHVVGSQLVFLDSPFLIIPKSNWAMLWRGV